MEIYVDNFQIEIGEQLKAARESKGLTQAQLGERIGVKAAQISKIEGGRNITLTTLIKMLKALDLTAKFSIIGSDADPIILGAR